MKPWQACSLRWAAEDLAFSSYDFIIVRDERTDLPQFQYCRTSDDGGPDRNRACSPNALQGYFQHPLAVLGDAAAPWD